jgi:hypothetical protein
MLLIGNWRFCQHQTIELHKDNTKKVATKANMGQNLEDTTLIYQMFIWSIWNQHRNSKINDDLWLPTYMKSKYQTIMGQKKACWTSMRVFLRLWNFVVQKCSQMFTKYVTTFTTHSYASNVFSRACKSASWSSYFFHIGWLQSRAVHFLCHNLIFCKVLCIYMLLTWHKTIIFQICG